MRMIAGMVLATMLLGTGFYAGRYDRVQVNGDSKPVQVASNDFGTLLAHITDGAEERTLKPLPVKIKGVK